MKKLTKAIEAAKLSREMAHAAEDAAAYTAVAEAAYVVARAVATAAAADAADTAARTVATAAATDAADAAAQARTLRACYKKEAG